MLNAPLRHKIFNMKTLVNEKNNLIFLGNSFDNDVSSIIDRFNLEKKRAVVITGMHSFENSIYKKKLLETLKAQGVDIVREVKVGSDPKLRDVDSFKLDGADINVLICVGGGSVIDFGKLLKLKKFKNTILFAIYTLPGSGTIVTPFAIVHNEEFKIGEHSNDMVPNFVYVNEDIVDNVPGDKKLMAVCDIFAHAIESFFSKMSDSESRSLSKKALDILYENIDNITEIKVKGLIYADIFAAKAESQALVLFPHAVGHYLTYFHDIPHPVASVCYMKKFLMLLCEKGVYIPEEYLELLNRLIEQLMDRFLLPAHKIEEEKYDELMSLIKVHMPFVFELAPISISDDEYMKILN